MSVNTTGLGPLVAVKDNGGAQGGTAPVLDLQEAALLKSATTLSAATTLLADGELAITDSTSTLVTLAYRSGDTVFTVVLT